MEIVATYVARSHHVTPSSSSLIKAWPVIHFVDANQALISLHISPMHKNNKEIR
jgi:hypothetical protein